MEKRQAGSILDGQNFWFENRLYVKIPEMALQIGQLGFLVNCVRVEKMGDHENLEKFETLYIHGLTMVEPVRTVLE